MNELKDISNAEIALKNRLYVSQWNLSTTLKLIKLNFKEAIVDLFYKDGKPIAVIVIDKNIQNTTKQSDSRLIQVFVKKSYRRQGIASELISRNRIDGVHFRLGEGLCNLESFRAKNRLIFDRQLRIKEFDF
jgi:GNAT superfamily N-acetyltransferase